MEEGERCYLLFCPVLFYYYEIYIFHQHHHDQSINFPTARSQAVLTRWNTLRRTDYNPPRGPSGVTNAAGTNGLSCLPMHRGARDNKFLVTHPIAGQRCITCAITRRAL
jgi:hypothetical protein